MGSKMRVFSVSRNVYRRKFPTGFTYRIYTAVHGFPSTARLLLSVAVETAGTWNQWPVELVQEIGRRITQVAEDTRETVFLFQRLSIALQRGNGKCGLLPKHVHCQ